MAKHSVADAKNNLPELIDRALAGEDVTITRHGRPVAELRPVGPAAGPITDADLDWLAARRAAGRARRRRDNAGRLLEKLRDGEMR
jgi:prevent-host-death family protein